MSKKNYQNIKQRIKDLAMPDMNHNNESEPNEIQRDLLKDDREFIKRFSNIPSRYLAADFRAKTEEQETLIKALRVNFSGKMFSDMKSFLLLGSVGTGKTHVVLGMLNRMIAANVYCRYITEYELLDLYYQKKYDEFNAFKKVKVLVIDELGKRPLVEWQMIHLEELISYRHNENLPTIFITNLTQLEFKEFVGDRITSRLRGDKVVTVVMNGEDLRGKNIG